VLVSRDTGAYLCSVTEEMYSSISPRESSESPRNSWAVLDSTRCLVC
jgi:hypothetical protein